MYSDTLLHSRLRNCLQTILELEGDLYNTEVGKFLQQELSLLKEMAYRLGDLPVEEKDVTRIEAATARFLHELQASISKATSGKVTSQRVLQ